ncbi:hypothetical protein [Bacteroides cellulosilyticus]|uniref:hypothetical protein n=1 Tax=Bacteroides cellulosilyticus TaxID=246787 RepID=UPI00321958A5
MKQSIDNLELLQLMERKQKLLLKLKVALELGRIDLVKELSYEFQAIVAQEHILTNL